MEGCLEGRKGWWMVNGLVEVGGCLVGDFISQGWSSLSGRLFGWLGGCICGLG